MGYLFNAITEARQHELAVQLAQTVTDLALNSTVLDLGGAQDLVVRDILPHEDLQSGAQNGWNGTVERWVQDWNASGTADAYNEAYEVDSSNRAEEKIIAFSSITLLDGNPVVEQVRFGAGTDGTQGVRRWFNVQSMQNDEEARGWMADAVIFGANADGNVEEYIDAKSDGHHTVYGGVVAEAVGKTISEPQNPRLTEPRTGTQGRVRADGGVPQVPGYEDVQPVTAVSPGWMTDEYLDDIVPTLPARQVA